MTAGRVSGGSTRSGSAMSEGNPGMHKLAFFAAAGLALAGCDSQAEKAIASYQLT